MVLLKFAVTAEIGLARFFSGYPGLEASPDIDPLCRRSGYRSSWVPLTASRFLSCGCSTWQPLLQAPHRDSLLWDMDCGSLRHASSHCHFSRNFQNPEQEREREGVSERASERVSE